MFAAHEGRGEASKRGTVLDPDDHAKNGRWREARRDFPRHNRPRWSRHIRRHSLNDVKIRAGLLAVSCGRRSALGCLPNAAAMLLCGRLASGFKFDCGRGRYGFESWTAWMQACHRVLVLCTLIGWRMDVQDMNRENRRRKHSRPCRDHQQSETSCQSPRHS